jgi:hypothetical protein
MKMSTRTKHTTVRLTPPFALRGVDEIQPLGDYAIRRGTKNSSMDLPESRHTARRPLRALSFNIIAQGGQLTPKASPPAECDHGQMTLLVSLVR